MSQHDLNMAYTLPAELYMAPRRRRSRSRSVLFGCMAMVFFCCCGSLTLVGLALNTEVGSVMAWPMAAATNRGEDLGIVCKNSPAAGYTNLLYERYGDQLNISINTPAKVGPHTYAANVRINGVAATYWFTLGNERGLFGVFGHCIREISPHPPTPRILPTPSTLIPA